MYYVFTSIYMYELSINMYLLCKYLNELCMYWYLCVESMKTTFWHIKWITSGTPFAPAQRWLPFHTTEGSQDSSSGDGSVKSHSSASLCVPKNPVVIGLKSVYTLTVLSMYMHVLVYTKAVHCIYHYHKVYMCICHDVHSIYMYIQCIYFMVLTTLYCQVINLYVGSCQALSSLVGSCQSQIQCLCTSFDMDVYIIHLRPCPLV